MTEYENQIVAILNKSPLIAEQDLANRLGLSGASVAEYIISLTDRGFIEGKDDVPRENRYAVVVGGANMDILGSPLSRLLIGDSNPGRVTCSPGGVGRNIAENLARLGSKTCLLSAVGKDTYGQAIVEQCVQSGVDMRACLQLDDPTSIYLSVLNGDNDMHVGINDMAILNCLNVEVLQTHKAMLSRADLIILDTNLADSALEYLLSYFSDRPIFVDTVSCVKAKKLMHFLSAIHTLKSNLKEAEQLSGITIADYSELPKLSDWFHGQGVHRIFLSLGVDGVFYSDGKNQALIPAVEVPMVNANGAGDAFLAGLAHGWLQNWEIGQATKFAMAAAIVALSHLATINPNMSEISVNRVIKESIC
ncbi:kinase [Shewanella sp. VB17]|uniref:PfkB family carbohydrate kinase n=1 Tax=Shewanella sp. VB17 TaxID=2739432 RepID=UPI0015666195|nr:PfkB family carbohydrate kinase [Shewanella sp. VB17]NRD73440.1 kinase [Shewanella sp. VB17]